MGLKTIILILAIVLFSGIIFNQLFLTENLNNQFGYKNEEQSLCNTISNFNESEPTIMPPNSMQSIPNITTNNPMALSMGNTLPPMSTMSSMTPTMMQSEAMTNMISSEEEMNMMYSQPQMTMMPSEEQMNMMYSQ